MVVSKASDHIQIKIKMPNPSQEPPVSSKAQNEDLKDMYVLCTFKIKIVAKIWIMGVSKTSDHIQIKLKMPNLCQEIPVFSKAPNQDLEDMDVLCTLKIKNREPQFGSLVYQRPVTISISRLRCQTQVRNIQHPQNPQMRT